MNQNIDERDIDILLTIAREQTQSTEVIHQATDIPKSTIHYRIKSLKENGVIKNDLLELDLEKIGLQMTVISEVWAEYDKGYHNQIGKQLANIEGVNQVYFTMGDTDFIAIARFSSRNKIVDLIENYGAIDGIERTSSKFVITTIKEHSAIGLIDDYEKETLLDAHRSNISSSG